MADFSQTRSEYLKVMMGDTKKALAPYRPEQVNDLGGTSFDVASLSDDDIDSAIKSMTATQQEGSEVFKALKSEREARDSASGNREKSVFENIGDFFTNIGTSITEGIFNAIDSVWDFAIGIAGGIGGGAFEQQNDFTDWVANAMTDDRWVAYATKAATQFNPFNKGFWTNEGGYWSDWAYENLQAEQERNYEGMEGIRTAGNFIGQIVPSIALAYFTGGSSLGATMAAQGGLSLATSYGQATSQALREGADFGAASAYGLTRGLVSGAITATTIGIGASALGNGGGLGGRLGDYLGSQVASRTGSKMAEVFATKAGEAFVYAGIAATSGFAQAMADPVFKQITYDADALAKAYGDNEKVQQTLARAGYAALNAAAMSVVQTSVRELGSLAWRGRDGYMAKFYSQKAIRAQGRLESEMRALNKDISNGKKVDIDARMERINNLSEQVEKFGKESFDYFDAIQRKAESLQAKSEKIDENGVVLNEKQPINYGRNKDLVNNFANLVQRKNITDIILKGRSASAEARTSSNPPTARLTMRQDGTGEINVGKAVILYPQGTESVLIQDSLNPNLPQVEAQIIGGALTAMPKSFAELQTIVSLAQDKEAFNSLPSVIELPLKQGEIRLDISVLAPKQIQQLSVLRPSDFKANGKGALVANLGDDKFFAMTQDSKAGQIINAEQATQWEKPIEVAAPSTEAVQPVKTNAEPSIVKMAAQGKAGKVYSLSSAKGTIDAIQDSIQELLSLDNLGGETKLNLPKQATARELFDTLNLGTDEQKVAVRENFKEKLLGMKVEYELKNFYGEVEDSYSGTWREFLATLDKEEIQKFNDDFDTLYNQLVNSGDDSTVTKLINKFAAKVTEMINSMQELKAQTKLTGHIEKHKTKVLRRYYHKDVADFGPDFDFDNKGFQVLLEPLHELRLTNGKQSYTGSSAIAGFKTFLEAYKMANFTKSFGENDEVVVVSSIYNQGLRDIANALVESIEQRSYTDKNGKVLYRALNAEQLSLLRKFQDEVEAMPKRAAEDAVRAVSDAKAAYVGVQRYVSTVSKNDRLGIARRAAQWFAERYASQTDALVYFLGDNELTRAVRDELYLSHAQKLGMVDRFQEKINDFRKLHNISGKKLSQKSSIVDSNGKAIEMRYLVHIYQHMMAGEESNNAKYINANSLYIRDVKDKLVHVVKLSYSDKEAIAKELQSKGLLEFAEFLHQIDNNNLGDIYDEDYIRDTHIPNSNRIKEHTAIHLESNRSELGKAYIKSGVAKYGQQKDRVTNIPTGVHLVIQDPEASIMAQVANQANIHFNDPVREKINAMLNTRIDQQGTTLREYIVQHNPEALKLIERAINGAYGINPNKKTPLIDFVGNGYVMSLIGLNPGSILRQPLSIMWANDISIESVLKFTIGANLNPRIWHNSTRLIEEIEKEFPELRLRGKKNEAIVGNAAAEAIGKVQDAIGKVAGFGLKKTDAWTVGHEAVGLLSLQAQNLGYGDVGTPENDEYVKYHYRAFYATQVSSNRITMSGARAGYYGGLGKMTSFMTGAVQGQIGHLLRASQQISEFGGKTQEHYDNLVEEAKQQYKDAKDAYEEAQKILDEIEQDFDEGMADKDDVRSAREDVRSAFDDYTKAAGDKADAENSAKAFRHFKDMGGTKGVIANRLAALFITGLALVAINELTARLKGQKKWTEFDASSAGKDLAVSSTIGWMPIVRDLVNAWKGYDLEIPEYAVVRNAYDLFKTIAAVVQDPTDKNARSLLRQTIESISAFLGIPAMNLWKYANGIIKTFSPATAIKMSNVLYGASSSGLTSTAKEYAEKNDISTAADLYQTLYATYKTGDIDREIAVEEAKLVKEGFNPIARNIPDYIQNEEEERVMLSDDQKVEFGKTYARANQQVVKLIRHIRYRSMDSESKAKAIKKVYDTYYEAAKFKALGIEPDSKLGKILAYAADYDADIIATLMLIQQNSTLADNRLFTKKEQAVNLVNKQPMSRKQKLLTLYLMGYGVTEENRKLVQAYLVSLGFTSKQAKEFLPS